MSELPWIISADDHIVEPTNLWTERLSHRDRENGPHVVQDTCEMTTDGVAFSNRASTYLKGGDGPVTDWWIYEDMVKPIQMVGACAGIPVEEWGPGPISYEDMRPGCYDLTARLLDMDENTTERSLCFPSVPRFAGQIFLEAKDKELALRCLRAYNDWMIEEWCGPSKGRLIPLCLVPLWDPQLAADEIRRNADRGCRAVSFSEMPSYLGLPSIHSPDRHWDPFFRACEETKTVIFMHIGSGSRMVETSPYAPWLVGITLDVAVSQISLAEWLYSGILVRFPTLKIAYSECQIGWMPYILERADKVFHRAKFWAGNDLPIDFPPSELMKGRVYATFFDDESGIKNRDAIGVSQLLIEVDYPHQDTTWPNSRKLVENIAAQVSPDELDRICRLNAIEMLDLPPEPVAGPNSQ